jgi:hypothetical protein
LRVSQGDVAVVTEEPTELAGGVVMIHALPQMTIAVNKLSGADVTAEGRFVLFESDAVLPDQVEQSSLLVLGLSMLLPPLLVLVVGRSLGSFDLVDALRSALPREGVSICNHHRPADRTDSSHGPQVLSHQTVPGSFFQSVPSLRSPALHTGLPGRRQVRSSRPTGATHGTVRRVVARVQVRQHVSPTLERTRGHATTVRADDRLRMDSEHV